MVFIQILDTVAVNVTIMYQSYSSPKITRQIFIKDLVAQFVIRFSTRTIYRVLIVLWEAQLKKKETIGHFKCHWFHSSCNLCLLQQCCLSVFNFIALLHLEDRSVQHTLYSENDNPKYASYLQKCF